MATSRFRYLEVKSTAKKASDTPEKVSRPIELAAIFRELMGDICEQEKFAIVVLNTAHECLWGGVLFIGGVYETLADAKVIFKKALSFPGARAIVLCHNHPSGALYPSDGDKKLTKRLVECGKFLDLPVLDHIIIQPFDSEYFSFSDAGLI